MTGAKEWPTYDPRPIEGSDCWEIIRIDEGREIRVAGPMSQPEAMDWMASNSGSPIEG